MRQAPSPGAPAGLPDRSLARLELSALGALFGLTLRQHTHGRKLWVLTLLYALACGLALLLRSLPVSTPPGVLEFALVYNLIPHVLAPLTALLFAAGMIQEEVEEQTLIYLLLRPLPRWALYLTKWLAAVLTSALLTGVFATALYAAIYLGTPELWGGILPGRALKAAALLALAQVGYGSLFGGLGLLLRRSLLGGVIYIALLEGLVANLDFVARRLTIVYYFRVLVLRWLDLPDSLRRRWQGEWQLNLIQAPSFPACVQALLLASVMLTVLSAWWFTTREFSMKTPESN